jgi:hypothetical protein
MKKLKYFHLSLIILWTFSVKCQSAELNFGVNAGVWRNNALANLKIHAFEQNRASNFTNPIQVGNSLHGTNLEFRVVNDSKIGYTIGWTNHRNVFTGGGPSETGYERTFNYKVRLNYLMFGAEFVPDKQLAFGASLDIGKWRIFYKFDTETETMDDYELFYGKSTGMLSQYTAFGFTQWIRFCFDKKARYQILLSHHYSMDESFLLYQGSYHYRFSNFNLSLRYAFNSN